MATEVTTLMLNLAALENIHSKAREEADKVPQAVSAARRAGASWAQIGKALGVSRQAAWEKYRDQDDDSPDA